MNPHPSLPADRLAPFTLADWLVEPKACQVSRDETVVKVRPQLLDLLVCLARRSGEIVLKDEILAEVWPGQYIAESGLSRCVAELRQVLQDDAQQPRFIQTVPKRGYRLIAPVTWLPGAAASEPLASEPKHAEDRPVPASEAPVSASVASPAPTHRRRIAAVGGLALVIVAVVAAVIVATRPRPARVTTRDTVLLADVKNTTRDAAFDDALRLALAVNLEQAPYLRILPQEEVRAALVRAGRSPEDRVLGPFALEVCRREGAAVLLAASIASLGSRYALGVEATACESGESLGRSLTEAASKERVLPALQEAATRIRQKLGESRDSLQQHDVPLVRATTSSLDALKALSLGEIHRDAGRHEDALPYFRQATELDPEFALAWARRGVTARNVGLRAEAIPAIRRAFELSERVSQPERFFIQQIYYRLVAGDPDKAIESARAWKRMYPGSATPPNSLASMLSDEMGRFDEALAEAREAVRLAPSTGMPYDNLMQACIGAGQWAEARKAMAEATRRGLDDWGLHLSMLNVALLEGDQPAIDREVNRPLPYPIAILARLQVRAWAAAGGGRLREARRLFGEALNEASRAGDDGATLDVLVTRAETEALVGDRAATRRDIRPLGPAWTSPLLLVHAAIALALADDLADARAFLREASRLAEADPAPLKVWLPTVEALVAARQGRGDEALRILQSTARCERGFDYGMVPVAARGVACAVSRRPGDAAAAFAEMTRYRGVPPPPWLAFARLNLARALRDAGDKAASLAAYDSFLASWKDADPDAPLLKVAQRERVAAAAR